MLHFKIKKYSIHRFLPTYRKILVSGLFDQQYYLTGNQDVAKAGLDPLAHFMRIGFKENRWPHPLFDPVYYASQLGAGATSQKNFLLHYIEEGEVLGFEPHPLFSPSYYREQCYENGIETSDNLLAHYMAIGSLKKIDPHPLFHSKYFTVRIMEAFQVAVKNPLIEYLSVPDYFYTSPHPLFDSNYYIDQKTENIDCMMPLLLHYLLLGYKKGLEPHPLFDSKSYFSQIRKTINSYYEPLGHYLMKGRKIGLNPLPFQVTDRSGTKEIESGLPEYYRDEISEYICSIGLQPDENNKTIEKQLFLDNLMSKKVRNEKENGKPFSLYKYMQKRVEKTCGVDIW